MPIPHKHALRVSLWKTFWQTSRSPRYGLAFVPCERGLLKRKGRGGGSFNFFWGSLAPQLHAITVSSPSCPSRATFNGCLRKHTPLLYPRRGSSTPVTRYVLRVCPWFNSRWMGVSEKLALRRNCEDYLLSRRSFVLKPSRLGYYSQLWYRLKS